MFRLVPGRGNPVDTGCATGSGGSSRAGAGGAALEAVGPDPGGGLDFDARLIRSSSMDISLSGRFPIILYVCFSPA